MKQTTTNTITSTNANATILQGAKKLASANAGKTKPATKKATASTKAIEKELTAYNSALSKLLKAIKTATIEDCKQPKASEKELAYKKACIECLKDWNITNDAAKNTARIFGNIQAFGKALNDIKRATATAFENESQEVQYQAQEFASLLVKIARAQATQEKKFKTLFSQVYNALVKEDLDKFNKGFETLYGFTPNSEQLKALKWLMLGNGKLASANAFSNKLNNAIITVLEHKGEWSPVKYKKTVHHLLKAVDIVKHNDVYDDTGAMQTAIVDTLLSKYKVKFDKTDTYIVKRQLVEEKIINKKMAILPPALEKLDYFK